MTHSYTWHDSLICVTRLTHTCDVTHSYISPIYEWVLNTLQHTATHCNTLQRTATHCNTHCNTLQHMHITCIWIHVWHDSSICATWRIHMWVTCMHSFRCETWLIRVWHESVVHVTWLIHMCDMTNSYVSPVWLIPMWDMTQHCVWRESYMFDMT